MKYFWNGHEIKAETKREKKILFYKMYLILCSYMAIMNFECDTDMFFRVSCAKWKNIGCIVTSYLINIYWI